MINKIYHISDIHIKLYRRKKLYVNVLLNLIEYINKTKDLNSLIVLTGDIFHSKTLLSPLAVFMADLYLNKLSLILPTIVIAGNHDANLTNLNRLDALSPIVSLINQHNDNLFYYKLTGWYKYLNLNIWVASVFDLKLPILMKPLGINICLYHGCLSNITANGVKLSGRFKVNDFSMFDYTLLGDIHKQQILCLNPLIAYAGSLVQLNFGLLIDTHGILVWKLDLNKVLSVYILNDYAYYNIIVLNGLIINLPNITAKHPRIKLKHSQTNSAKLKLIQLKLKLMYLIDLIMLYKTSLLLLVKGCDFIYNLQDINNTDYQLKILKLYILYIKYNITALDLLKIYLINRLLNRIYKTKRLNSSQNIWSVLKLLFSNFFSYGLNNVILFNEHKGIIGIVGLNRAGKTSLISTLMFMLYDKCDATNKSLSVLNNLKTNLYGKLSLLINGKPYIILRYGLVDKKRLNLPIKVKFYTYDLLGSIVDLSGTLRSSTNQIIQSYIGTYLDSSSTFFSTQGKSNTFILMTNTSRKGQLNSLLNLTIFLDCATLAGLRSKYLKGYLNSVDVTNVEKTIEERTNTVKVTNHLLKQKLNEILGFLLDLECKLKLLKVLLLTRKSELELDIDIEKINIGIPITNSSIKKVLKEIENLTSKKLLILNSLDLVLQLLSVCDLEGLIKRRLILLPFKALQEALLKKRDKLLILLLENNKKILLLKDLLYDLNCHFCINNPLTKDAINSKLQIALLTSLIEVLDGKLKSLEQFIKLLNQLNKDIKSIQLLILPLKNKYILLKSHITQSLLDNSNKLNTLKQQLQNLNEMKDKYLLNKQVILNNKALDIKINEVNKLLQTLKQTIKQSNNEIISCKITITNSNLLLKSNREILNMYNLKSYELSILLKYKTLMGKNGLQYYITSNIISVLLTLINKVLLMLANFTVLFVMDGKYIDINIVYPNKRYQILTCSGFLKFLMSIAIRHTLSSITNKSKGKIFVIDLGFGVLDSLNVSSFNKILEFIALRYLTLLVVSHLLVMRSMFLKTIAIEYKSGESKIT